MISFNLCTSVSSLRCGLSRLRSPSISLFNAATLPPTLVTHALRVCVCVFEPQVVVLRKRDFLDLDNPLLAWMLDYDAVSAVLKSLPAFKGLKQDQMERILDRFEARQELYKGDTILSQGSLVSSWTERDGA